MASQDFYVHNLSPFIFEVSKLDFGWLTNPVGAAVTAAVLIGGFLAAWMLEKKWAERQGAVIVLGALRTLIIATAVGIGVCFGLQKAGIDWGLRWYSTMYLVGFIYVYCACRYWISKGTIMLTPILLDTLIAYLIIGMIAGARTFYVFVYNWDEYSGDMGSIYKVWEGGLSFHGGIVGVILAIILFCKRHKIPFWHLADKLCLTVPFGIGIGRIGNYMNGELYGRVISSDIPWAVVFSNTGGGPQPRHPSQLYQSLGEGWLLFVTLLLINRRKNVEGTISVAFIFFYGLYRFVVEYFREADEQLKYYFNNTTTMGQILCAVTMLIAVGLYFTLLRENPRVGSADWQKRLDDFMVKRREVEA